MPERAHIHKRIGEQTKEALKARAALHYFPSMKPLNILLALALTALVSPAAESYTIAVIPKATSHEFWKSIHAGAVKAQRELTEKGAKVEIIWQGPLREDNRDQQIQVV